MLGGGVGDGLGEVHAAIRGLLHGALELLLLPVQRGALGHGEVRVGELRVIPELLAQPPRDRGHLRGAADEQAAVDAGHALGGGRHQRAAVSSSVRSSSVLVASSRSSRVTETLARSAPLVTSTSARSRCESDCLTSSAWVSRSASA